MLAQQYYHNTEQFFSCEMLSRASWTTLHKDFTYAMLYQEY